MKPDLQRLLRQTQRYKEATQRLHAAAGTLIVPVARTAPDGTTHTEMLPITLSAAIENPTIWNTILYRAGELSGRGFSRPSQRAIPKHRVGMDHPRGPRRPDKVAAAEREAKNPCLYGKINFPRHLCAGSS